MANAHLVGGHKGGIRCQESSRYAAAFAEIKMQIHPLGTPGVRVESSSFLSQRLWRSQPCDTINLLCDGFLLMGQERAIDRAVHPSAPSPSQKEPTLVNRVVSTAV